MSRKSIDAQIAAGIVHERYGDMHAIVEVPFDRQNRRRSAFEREIKDVATRFGVKTHMLADRKVKWPRLGKRIFGRS
jgi:hypothetical protein